MSATARVVRIWIRISSGSSAIGQGGGGEAEVGGGSGSIRSCENSSRRLFREGETLVLGPCSEWWPVPGTVAGALDGFG